MRGTLPVLAVLASLATAACDDGNGSASSTLVFPGGKVTASESGETTKLKYETAFGDVDVEHDGKTTVVNSAHGTTTLKSDQGLDALGVDVPDGAVPLHAGNAVASVKTPAGERITATLRTTRTPEEVVAFYEERYTLQTKAIIGDAAIITAKLDDGRYLNVNLGSPKNGGRDLVVTVTIPPR